MLMPQKIEYEVGRDVHGRTVRVIYEASGNQWTIHVLAANQRDEDSVICGLTPECIREIAKLVGDAPHGHVLCSYLLPNKSQNPGI